MTVAVRSIVQPDNFDLGVTMKMEAIHAACDHWIWLGREEHSGPLFAILRLVLPDSQRSRCVY